MQVDQRFDQVVVEQPALFERQVLPQDSSEREIEVVVPVVAGIPDEEFEGPDAERLLVRRIGPAVAGGEMRNRDFHGSAGTQYPVGFLQNWNVLDMLQKLECADVIEALALKRP